MSATTKQAPVVAYRAVGGRSIAVQSEPLALGRLCAMDSHGDVAVPSFETCPDYILAKWGFKLAELSNIQVTQVSPSYAVITFVDRFNLPHVVQVQAVA